MMNLNPSQKNTLKNPCKRKLNKHDVNLKRRPVLYFQIGLILCLLASYGLFEMKFEETIYKTPEVGMDQDPVIVIMKTYIIEKPKNIEKSISPKNKEKILDGNIKAGDTNVTVALVSDDSVNPEKPVMHRDSISKSLNPVISRTPPTKGRTMKAIEQVPLYPGCEKKKGRVKQEKCLSDRINKLVARRFNTDLASDLGLTGVQKIQVEFKIDEEGRVTEIKTRAAHPELEKEAQRVINKLPKMTPGMQQNKPVGVLYNLPINVQAYQN